VTDLQSNENGETPVSLSEEHRNQLRAYRESIDNIDASLVFMLAERFKITKAVGYYKKEHDLPPADPSREQKQIERLRSLAQSANLDPEFSEKFLQFIIREVIQHHERIRERGDI
jgi:chorismate mutase